MMNSTSNKILVILLTLHVLSALASTTTTSLRTRRAHRGHQSTKLQLDIVSNDSPDRQLKVKNKSKAKDQTKPTVEPALAPSSSNHPTSFVQSCTSIANYFMCDDEKIAICYKHNAHYHNACVKMYDDDILNKVPGVDLYKDKYELLNCGCCPEDHLISHNNILEEFVEVKWPKSYKNDPYCDYITEGPSIAPSREPTKSASPSAVPSFHPSKSIQPSISPSRQPSSLPSKGPTASPSFGPTRVPSTSPSTSPSEGPTVSPSVGPTTSPSTTPSTSPSAGPTIVPSVEPTTFPSISPSKFPSKGPTSSPSNEPTISVEPSLHPSNQPISTPMPSLSSPPSRTQCMTWDAYDVDDITTFCDAWPDGQKCCSNEEGTTVNVGNVCAGWKSPSSITLCKGSCQGTAACKNFGKFKSNQVIEIGINACQGGSTCAGAGLDVAIIQIGDGSCMGHNACRNLGANFSPALQIGDGSCVGRNSCGSLGLSNVDITIGDGSCVGYQACQNCGKTSDVVKIGNGACVGEEDDGVSDSGGRSCWRFGHDSDNASDHPDLIEVGGGACVGASTTDTTEVCQSCYAGVSLTSVTVPDAGDACTDAITVA